VRKDTASPNGNQGIKLAPRWLHQLFKKDNNDLIWTFVVSDDTTND
jgi:hypothetical protein